MRLLIALKGYSSVSKKLERMAAVVKKPSVPMQQSAIYLTQQALLAFEDQGKPEKWAPLSLMTLFIKAHRADRPKETNPMIGSDTGRLKGSFIPVISDDMNQFGAATNVEYAGMMQDGGTTEPRDISIAFFTRKLKAGTKPKKKRSDGMQGVKPYVMHLKGGQKVPARPFFPEGIDELKSWGYHAQIKEIFRQYFNGLQS